MPRSRQKKSIHGKEPGHDTLNNKPLADEDSASISQLATERQHTEESMANLDVILRELRDICQGNSDTLREGK